MRHILTLLFVFLIYKPVFSQYHKVEIIGEVIDTTNRQQFYNIIVYNKSINKGYFGSPDGTFRIEAESNETIIISVEGYEKNTITIDDSNLKPRLYYTIYLTPKVKQLKTIVIQPLKTLQQIKEERENLALKESKKTVEGINIIQSPITALYERYSKRAQTVKKINELKYNDEKSQILKELLSIYVVYEIIELDNKDFDSFINFLNINDEILTKTTDIELATFIKDKFEHYKSLKSKNN